MCQPLYNILCQLKFKKELGLFKGTVNEVYNNIKLLRDVEKNLQMSTTKVATEAIEK